jgi:hypothetical protein
MRSATPRRPKRLRYAPRPAETPGRRYATPGPLRADQRCYGVAAPGPAGAAGRPLRAAAGQPGPSRYTAAGAAPWR